MAEMNQNKNDSLNKKKVNWKFCLSQLMKSDRSHVVL